MASDTPAAVASISISDDERKRIAGELGLDESQYTEVPSKLDIARYDIEEQESEVEGFAVNAFVARATVSPSVAQAPGGAVASLKLNVGRIPGSILVPL